MLFYHQPHLKHNCMKLKSPSNGKEATINRALDGSTYPSWKLVHSVFGKLNYGGLKHNSLYLGLVLPSGGWQSLIGHRQERDWIFDLSHPIKMNRSGSSNYASTVQSHSVKKIYCSQSKWPRLTERTGSEWKLMKYLV